MPWCDNKIICHSYPYSDLSNLSSFLRPIILQELANGCTGNARKSKFLSIMPPCSKTAWDDYVEYEDCVLSQENSNGSGTEANKRMTLNPFESTINYALADFYGNILDKALVPSTETLTGSNEPETMHLALDFSLNGEPWGEQIQALCAPIDPGLKFGTMPLLPSYFDDPYIFKKETAKPIQTAQPAATDSSSFSTNNSAFSSPSDTCTAGEESDASEIGSEDVELYYDDLLGWDDEAAEETAEEREMYRRIWFELLAFNDRPSGEEGEDNVWDGFGWDKFLEPDADEDSF